MKNQNNGSKNWAKEFETFASAESIDPPKKLKNKILSEVHKDLNPGILKVFSKMALIHFIVGSLMLLICPQFGWIRAYGYLYAFWRDRLLSGLRVSLSGSQLASHQFKLKARRNRTSSKNSHTSASSACLAFNRGIHFTWSHYRNGVGFGLGCWLGRWRNCYS